MKSKKPILVTGSHRSGSTWVGQTLAQSPHVFYIHEPFNIQYPNPGVCGAKFSHWFEYVTTSSEKPYRRHLKRTVELRYNLLGHFLHARSIHDKFRAVKMSARFTKHRWLNARPLIKDPIALMSAEWLTSTFNMSVLVMIRHPAAFVGSIKKVHWQFPFEDLLQQPKLIKHHLSSFKAEIERAVREELDIIDQAILLWNISAHMILTYREMHKKWLFIRHEDLSRAPFENFESIFRQLNIPYTHNVQNYIQANCFPVVQGKYRPGILTRNSRANIKEWYNRLTSDEIERIKKSVKPWAESFYPEADW